MITLKEQKRITSEIISYLNSLPEYSGTKSYYNLWDAHILKSLVNDIEFYVHSDDIEKGAIIFGCYGKFNRHVEGSILTKPYNLKYNFYFDIDLDIEDFKQYLDYVLDILRKK